MLKATIREYYGTEERDSRCFDLVPTAGAITIGRSIACTHQIGTTLGEWALGIARVQATIEFQGDAMILIDGTREKPSTNGIWVHGEQVRGEVSLTPGIELTLFKSGRAKVALVVNDGLTTDHGQNGNTYTGEDLLSILQEQIGNLKEQVPRLETEVEKLAGQLAERQAIDSNQTEQLTLLQRRFNRVITILLAAVAVIVFGSGFLASDDRKQLESAATSVAIAVAAVYLKSKENEVASAGSRK